MKNYLGKSLLVFVLLFTMSCSNEKVEETELTSEETALTSRPAKPTNAATRKVDDKYYYIQNVNSGKFLDMSRFSTKNGGNLYQYEFTGRENQRWLITKFDNNARIRCENGGLSLDVNILADNQNGANVQQWRKGSRDNQKWVFSTGGTGNPEHFLIQNLWTGRYLDVFRSSEDDRGNVIVYDKKDSNRDNQLWKLYRVDQQ